MTTRTYAMGAYRSNGTPIKTKRTYHRTKKHNTTYAGQYTKRELATRVFYARITITAFIALMVFYGGYKTLEAKNTNSFTIINAESMEKRIENELPIEPEHPAMAITRIAKEQNFQWPNYLIALATCERPDFDPSKDNTKGNHPAWSKDRGQFAINDYFHPDVTDDQAHDIVFSTQWTIDKINAGEQYIWVCNARAKRMAKTIRGNVLDMNERELLNTINLIKYVK